MIAQYVLTNTYGQNPAYMHE